MITVVHTGRFGWVTDFGAALVATNVDDGTTFTVPRYGVWRHNAARGKAEVVHTCEALDEAVGVCDTGVLRIGGPMMGGRDV